MSQAVALPARSFSTYDASRSDEFIRFIATLLRHSFFLADSFSSSALGTMQTLDALVLEHVQSPASSKLRTLVPSIGRIHMPLVCAEAFATYDLKYRLTARTQVPPSEEEVRHLLNLAQVFASAVGLEFISFDGDDTLYADGRNFAQSDASKLARYIVALLKNGVAVALVTAAGYKGAPEKYEARLDGLLKHFTAEALPAEALAKFYVVGGECNYLFECECVGEERSAEDGRGTVRLREVVGSWCDEHAAWADEDVGRVLDTAEASLRATAAELSLRCRVIRKERAVGIIAGGSEAKSRVPEGSGSRRMRRELLDEAALRLQTAVGQLGLNVPFCCFNGGADVWCDIGNKAFGIGALQQRLHVVPSQCLHVGDQFSTSIGNDFAARMASPTLWVAGPKETQHVLKQLLERRGVSTKTSEPKAWPPSTKRFLVFSDPLKLEDGDRVEGEPSPGKRDGQGEGDGVPDWVRG